MKDLASDAINYLAASGMFFPSRGIRRHSNNRTQNLAETHLHDGTPYKSHKWIRKKSFEFSNCVGIKIERIAAAHVVRYLVDVRQKVHGSHSESLGIL